MIFDAHDLAVGDQQRIAQAIECSLAQADGEAAAPLPSTMRHSSSASADDGGLLRRPKVQLGLDVLLCE